MHAGVSISDPLSLVITLIWQILHLCRYTQTTHRRARINNRLEIIALVSAKWTKDSDPHTVRIGGQRAPCPRRPKRKRTLVKPSNKGRALYLTSRPRTTMRPGGTAWWLLEVVAVPEITTPPPPTPRGWCLEGRPVVDAVLAALLHGRDGRRAPVRDALARTHAHTRTTTPHYISLEGVAGPRA